jgi:hypothetical protein
MQNANSCKIDNWFQRLPLIDQGRQLIFMRGVSRGVPNRRNFDLVTSRPEDLENPREAQTKARPGIG